MKKNPQWLRQWFRKNSYLSDGKHKETRVLSDGNFLFYFTFKMFSEKLCLHTARFFTCSSMSLSTYMHLSPTQSHISIHNDIYFHMATHLSFKYISLLHLFSLQLPLPCLHMVTNLHTFFILPTHSPHSYIPLDVFLHLPFSTHTPLIRLCSFPSSSLHSSTQLPILCGLSPPIAKL